jgi:hypothetical protein
MTEQLHTTYRSILEHFLEDPKTTNKRDAHYAELHLAVLVKRGRIVASAMNRYGTRSRGSGFARSSLHAEKNVVKELGDISQLRGCDMLVVRFSRNPVLEGHDRFLGSKPCYGCDKFLEKCMREYGLKNVYYTAT